jgi:AraC family transcriptional regulator, transcriptional activator of pobA
MASNQSWDVTPAFEVPGLGSNGERFVYELVKLGGRSELPRPFLHRHRYYHILWMDDAHGQHVLDFECYEIKPRSVFFISPGQIHGWTTTVGATGYAMNFSADFFLQLFPRMEDSSDFPFFHIANAEPVLYLDEETHRELSPLLLEIDKECRETRRWRFNVVSSLLQILLIKIRRLHVPQATESALPHSYSLAKRYKILIEQQYLATDSMRDYASILCVSERKLNDAVKATTGKTASQLLHDRVLMEAKRLLALSEMSIAQIAYSLNFEDFAYFCRFFKKQSGSTPGEFRKQFCSQLS